AIGGEMLIANWPAILTHAFPARQRGKVLGWQSTAVYLGIATGPPLGGFLASLIHWRAVFYINVPVGALALYLSLRFIPEDAPSGRREQFDLVGAPTYLVGLVAVVPAVSQGHAWGWASAPVLGFLAFGLVVLFAFTQIEARVPAPMLRFGLFRQRSFSASVMSAVLNSMGVSSTFFLVPFY